MKSTNISALMPRTLQRKTLLFLLLPTFLILMVIGIAGLTLIRNVLLEQWKEAAIAKLQRSAHHVDMRLMRPKELLRFLQHDNQRNINQQEYQVVLDQLRMLDGVVEVESTWYGEIQGEFDTRQIDEKLTPVDRYYQLQQLAITRPRYNQKIMSDTVSLIASFKDRSSKPVGHIEVVISFYDLIDQIVKAPWWNSNQAVLVDDAGNILTGTEPYTKNSIANSVVEFAHFDEHGPLEQKTWTAMQENVYGTIFGTGIPPERVSGFYRLSEAPWTMVIISSGSNVLQPIISFRNSYFLLGIVGIVLALLYIKVVIGRITGSIIKVSHAANRLASGTFEDPLVVVSHDEVGELTRSFNVMAQHLKERLALREEMDLAREVQQHLLPNDNYSAEGIEIAGLSIYCQQTGGDYYDLIPPHHNTGKATVVVGDVVGHGFGAALIMSSLRALLRSRASQPGTPLQILHDVNTLLCQDTAQSGNFASLFFLTIDMSVKQMTWIRCGHDPAIIYNPDSKTFSELRGEGLVLGFDKEYDFQENSYDFGNPKQVILICTDGAWEAENTSGEQFGKGKLKELLATYHQLPAEMLVHKITDSIKKFMAGHPQHDDITLAIVKTW
ncbi:PP2C family protein-serine/threonine phosphatase [Desulfosediminicola flagellatus]|uniref:PP2C family protein-serine/threonine phosphatase n=1 Tax=Desulfosediminicola flagellatus TaxID=2569541 RepID=UPI0010AC76D7|nr:SpoIIE family protein phosphatase [Desulfosediminicola flagellatus]